MNIAALIDLLPDTVKLDSIDFQSVKMKDGKIGTRVILDRILTETEKQQMTSNHFRGLDCIANIDMPRKLNVVIFMLCKRGVKHGIRKEKTRRCKLLSYIP